MRIISEADIKIFDEIAEKRKKEILEAKDELVIKGTTYFVSTSGDDNNDGLSKEKPWKTLRKVSSADLKYGDGVLFKRGDLFRGWVQTKSGVTYGAYGSGDKPKIYSWDKDLADPALWTLVDKEHSIWRLNDKILDCGTLVFNDGEYHSYKHIPSYVRGKFVCRNDESKEFVMANEMTGNLDIYWYFDAIMTTEESRNQTFPIPKMCDESYGDLYLKCDQGNPGEVFSSIEGVARTHMFCVEENDDVCIDNICIKFVGMHAVAGQSTCVKGLKVTNCEIGWIGGTIQHYLGTDPNYPQGDRGTVTRFGNGVEIYGGCDNYTVENCYIYQCYDAGITHQFTTGGDKTTLTNIRYKNNLIEKCVYSIEYFLEMTCGDTESYMENIEISGNLLRQAGYGWGQQRHNKHTPSHIKGWNFNNVARNFSIHDNIFDRSAFRLIHCVADKTEYCPSLSNNTYVQHEGGLLGQWGGKENGEVETKVVNENSEYAIQNEYGDENAKVYLIK